MGCGSSSAAAATAKPDEQRVNVNEFAASRDAAKVFREKQAKLVSEQKERNSDETATENGAKRIRPAEEPAAESNPPALCALTIDMQQPTGIDSSSASLEVGTATLDMATTGDMQSSEADSTYPAEPGPTAVHSSTMNAPQEDDDDTIDTTSVGNAGEEPTENNEQADSAIAVVSDDNSTAVVDAMAPGGPRDPDGDAAAIPPPEAGSPSLEADVTVDHVQCSIISDVKEDAKPENIAQEIELDGADLPPAEPSVRPAVEPSPEPLIESDDDVTRGYLYRRGYVNKAWRRQYFVLYSGTIACYENPIEEYPFGTGLKNYTTLTFGKMESFEEEHRMHIYFEEPTSEQQLILDTLARNSTVTIMLEAGAVRELHLQADSDNEFIRWKRALTLNIAHAYEDAKQGERLTIPPEAIPKSDMLPNNQIPVLERSFSRSGTFTSKKNVLIADGSFDVEEADQESTEVEGGDGVGSGSLDAIEEETNHHEQDIPDENIPETNLTEQGNESSLEMLHREHTLSEETATADSLRVVASSESEDHHNTSGVADTATTMTGDTRSVGTASTVVDEEDEEDGEDEDGIILTPIPFETKKAAAIAALEGVDVYKEYFSKQGHFFKNWKRRYFVLDSGILYYYEKDMAEPPYGSGLKGFIPLLFAVVDVNTSTQRMHIRFPPLTDEQKTLVGEDSTKNGAITVESEEGKDLLIEAESVEQLVFWEGCVHKHVAFALAKATQNIALTVPAEHKEAAAKPSKGGGRMKRASILVRNTRADSTGPRDSRRDSKG